jgi:hypothetical protein
MRGAEAWTRSTRNAATRAKRLDALFAGLKSGRLRRDLGAGDGQVQEHCRGLLPDLIGTPGGGYAGLALLRNMQGTAAEKLALFENLAGEDRAELCAGMRLRGGVYDKPHSGVECVKLP